MGKTKWFRNIKDKGYLDSTFILLGLALVLSVIMLVGSLTNGYESQPIKDSRQNDTVFVTDTIYVDQLINLDRLDSIEEILYYEVVDNQLYLYTKKDSIQDEIERYHYIKSLDSESEGWD
jgi:hypothetical protein